MKIVIKNIKVDVSCENIESVIKSKITKKINTNNFKYKVLKKSIDARDKRQVYFVYELLVEINVQDKKIKHILNQDNIELYKDSTYKIKKINDTKKHVDIIGFGPAGIFCAYVLSESGFDVSVYERGEKIEKRISDVELFWDKNKLNINSNVQFGEGGAGTFSDGKLNTMIKEKERQKFVFNTFVENGAPEEILYLNKPHIGTDKLRDVITNIREKLIKNNVKINFNSCLTDIKVIDDKIEGFIINDSKYIKTDNLVLALGHSARDTFKMLSSYLNIVPKPFAVGVRVQHSQDLINKNQYGKFAKYLPAADYKLTHQTTDGRGVYSFCMCPGGFVVNSSSEENHLCINGMSNQSRGENTANSAIVVTVSPSDYGNNIFDGMNFQRMLEKKAYELGEGCIPIQFFKDYLNNIISKKSDGIYSNIKGYTKYANLNDIFPEYINKSLKEGIIAFNSKIKGFSDDNVLLAAVESRTSSPIRILRDEFYQSNIKNIYPCGEGAGYAGGITSAAIDGMKIAEAIIKNT